MTGFWYLRVRWEHDFADDPVAIVSEIGPDGYERRKVEFFRDGRLGWADEEHEVGGTGLGQVVVPPLEEIDAQQEFAASRVEATEFDQAWARATRRL
ncbi:hypothetical protein Amsp01_046130 [Amycolatopsis sp. NBRC 101858]|uniref:DUF6881 domain-containing protein n=1 Tax=Amycolatopsis sp. NBRC 101858 TaxID=3032200 RepID=UPI0024A4CA0B|nr:hypothetical protein [Amycolatopsis sp. NBRC 101858]GLY38589.1 hypothetical protein Amsp01_046130 [Amycolatopsis sp. NBRC 101858]